MALMSGTYFVTLNFKHAGFCNTQPWTIQNFVIPIRHFHWCLSYNILYACSERLNAQHCKIDWLWKCNLKEKDYCTVKLNVY